MAEEVKKEIGQDFADYLKSKAKVEGNAATLTLSDLKGFYKSKGVTESMVDQWSGLQKEVETGLYRFANDKVLEQVKDLKKKGKTVITVSFSNGKTSTARKLKLTLKVK